MENFDINPTTISPSTKTPLEVTLYTMPELSELEKRRQENIARNKQYMADLLGDVSADITRGINKVGQKAAAEKKRRAVNVASRAKKVKSESPQPIRRSRRLAGVKLDDSDEVKKFELEEDKRARAKEELEKLKTQRVNGDVKLIDLIKDGDEDDEKLLQKFHSVMNSSRNFSIGDYYETISKKDNSSQDIQKLRKEFNGKKIYDEFAPNQIKLTPERMTSIVFHPTLEKKLIIGGDTNGNCGIWDSSNHEDVDITGFKLHGRAIHKYEFDINDPTKVYTASYDASIRIIDLKTLKSSQFFVNEDDTGISDINFNNDHEIYYTTLDGEFGRLDLRSHDHSKRTVLRLSNKKIGGFAINPQRSHQIATASLDRTLRLWDIRVSTKAEWNEVDKLKSFHSYGTYDSRLSVSTVDWNNSNDLVCNGYDDTINIFNLGKDALNWNQTFQLPKEELHPNHKIKHNCQTGRWVSILKAKWQKFPTDKNEKFVIANMNKYYDVYTRGGVQIAHLTDDWMTNVPAVCNFHQTENWLVGGGASGKVYLFA